MTFLLYFSCICLIAFSFSSFLPLPLILHTFRHSLGLANTTNGIYHPQDIDSIHNTGYINIFRGAPVVQIPQSFIDETNTKTWIDPQLAYVLPTGGEKVVKVVLEGNTQINDFKNRDNSLEVYAYKKMGCAILAHHNWGIYQNTSINQTFENPYGF